MTTTEIRGIMVTTLFVAVFVCRFTHGVVAQSLSPQQRRELRHDLTAAAPSVRVAAVKGLGHAGPSADFALPAVASLLNDKDPRVRGAAAEALIQCRPRIAVFLPRLLSFLGDRDRTVRGAAVSVLRGITTAASSDILSRIAHLRTHTQAIKGDTTDQSLLQIQAAWVQMVPALVALLDDEDAGIRASAASSLVRIGDFLTAVTGDLLDTLKAAEWRNRSFACHPLAGVVTHAISLTPLLEPVRMGTATSERKAVAQTAHSIRLIPARAVPALARAVKDGSPEVRLSAIASLSAIGPAAARAASAVIQAFDDSDHVVRVFAASFFGAMGPKSSTTVPLLRKALNSPRPRVRSCAADAFREMAMHSSAAVPAVPWLIRLLNDEDAQVRASSATALGRQGPGASSAVPLLVVMLHDRDAGPRAAAAGALGSIGPSAIPGVPLLVGLLQDGNSGVRTAAAESLMHLAGSIAELPMNASVQSIQASRRTLESVSTALKATHPSGQDERNTLSNATGSVGRALASVTARQRRDAPDRRMVTPRSALAAFVLIQVCLVTFAIARRNQPAAAKKRGSRSAISR